MKEWKERNGAVPGEGLAMGQVSGRKLLRLCSGMVMAVGLAAAVGMTALPGGAAVVLADTQEDAAAPEYRTDYYMIVESKAGGIDLYAKPDFESARLSEEKIPNGTALHIEGEVEDGKRTWGYVTYQGVYGYVPLDDCRPAQSRQEAIESDLYLAGRDNVDYQADYEVTADAEAGSQYLYQGPGEKYGTVPGAKEIPNGEKLHITQEANLADESSWGATEWDGKSGWVNLEDTEKGEGNSAGVQKDNAIDASKDETAAPTVTGTPESNTSASDKAMENTPSSAPEATPENTPIVSPAATATPKEDPTATASPATKNPEESQQEPSPEVTAALSSQVKTEEASASMTPFLWIGAIAVLSALGLLIYHLKKR